MSSTPSKPDPTLDDVPIVLLPPGVDVDALLAAIAAEGKAAAERAAAERAAAEKDAVEEAASRRAAVEKAATERAAAQEVAAEKAAAERAAARVDAERLAAEKVVVEAAAQKAVAQKVAAQKAEAARVAAASRATASVASAPTQPRTRPAPPPVQEPLLTELGDLLEESVPPSGPSLEEIAHEIESEIESEIDTTGRRRVSASRLGLVAAWLCIAALGVLLTIGLPYYRLGVGLRSFHHLHTYLRPSGLVGLSLGIAGTVVMLLGLVYLVRKMRIKLGRVATLSGWLRFHIVAGLVGPALVLFHTSFQLTSALGTAAIIALAIVVGSGVLGRYLLILVPRSFQGRELELSVIQQRLVVYRQKLETLGLRPRRLEASVREGHGPRLFGFGIALLRVFYGDWQDRREFKSLKQQIRQRHITRDEARRIRILFRRLHRERQWLVRSRELRHLVSAWRFGHRWFTVVLLAAVAFHVGIAIRYGGLWILGGDGK